MKNNRYVNEMSVRMLTNRPEHITSCLNSGILTSSYSQIEYTAGLSQITQSRPHNHVLKQETQTVFL